MGSSISHPIFSKDLETIRPPKGWGHFKPETSSVPPFSNKNSSSAALRAPASQCKGPGRICIGGSHLDAPFFRPISQLITQKRSTSRILKITFKVIFWGTWQWKKKELLFFLSKAKLKKKSEMNLHAQEVILPHWILHKVPVVLKREYPDCLFTTEFLKTHTSPGS